MPRILQIDVKSLGFTPKMPFPTEPWLRTVENLAHELPSSVENTGVPHMRLVIPEQDTR